jgi:hypothetical protein
VLVNQVRYNVASFKVIKGFIKNPLGIDVEIPLVGIKVPEKVAKIRSETAAV